MQEVNSQNDKFGNCHGHCSPKYALNKLYLFYVWCVQCKEVRLVFAGRDVFSTTCYYSLPEGFALSLHIELLLN